MTCARWGLRVSFFRHCSHRHLERAALWISLRPTTGGRIHTRSGLPVELGHGVRIQDVEARQAFRVAHEDARAPILLHHCARPGARPLDARLLERSTLGLNGLGSDVHITHLPEREPHFRPIGHDDIGRQQNDAAVWVIFGRKMDTDGDLMDLPHLRHRTRHANMAQALPAQTRCPDGVAARQVFALRRAAPPVHKPDDTPRANCDTDAHARPIKK